MRIYQVDAFTDEPFRGNPAGVCILEREEPDKLLQNIAMEMNLPETAFLLKKEEGFSLRWFTPECEVDLCGHATLAGAHVLFELGMLKRDERAVFYTKSGILYATYDHSMITLDFPAEEAREIEIPLGSLKEALGVDCIKYCGKNRMDILIELENEECVRSLKPDFSKLSRIGTDRGFIITAKGKEYDFVSRFFAFDIGIPEDPVTGSAHCCLAPYWAKKLGKREFRAYQASKRGGELFLRLKGDRVLIGGRAKTVMICDLLI